ncbi:MAG TPA: hypothetical protein VFH91_09545 [Pyrinomonadaceae bacterium]|nr:hypothetical protein [Pyrinomonadaceae bacterium]
MPAYNKRPSTVVLMALWCFDICRPSSGLRPNTNNDGRSFARDPNYGPLDRPECLSVLGFHRTLPRNTRFAAHTLPFKAPRRIIDYF